MIYAHHTRCKKRESLRNVKDGLIKKSRTHNKNSPTILHYRLKIFEPQNMVESLKLYFHYVWSSTFLTICDVSAGIVSSHPLFNT